MQPVNPLHHKAGVIVLIYRLHFNIFRLYAYHTRLRNISALRGAAERANIDVKFITFTNVGPASKWVLSAFIVRT